VLDARRKRFAAAFVAASITMLLLNPPSSAAQDSSDLTWCGDHSSLMVLGDSGSTGTGMPDYPRNTEFYAETVNGWASRVGRNAKAEWGTRTTVIARNGARISDFLPGGRFPETVNAVNRVRELQPSMVIIELGGNDFSIDKDPNLFDQQYRQLVSNLKTASPRTTVLLTVIWEIGTREAPGGVNPWSGYTSRIDATARSTGSALIDLRQYIPKGGTPESAGFYLPDKIHLTPPGHGAMQAGIWTLLWASC